MSQRPAPPASAENFAASFHFDQRLAPFDLKASRAHAQMLGRQKIVSSREAARLVKGLDRLAQRWRKSESLPPAEDVHYALERALYREVGETAGRLHTARSRNDQTVTALRLYVREAIDRQRLALAELTRAFVTQAEKAGTHLMPGYTHFQPGQPILLAQHLLAYAWMFARDRDRLADVRRRLNLSPLGAAALAGTSFPIDRVWTARALAFDGVVENSLDAVADRDFVVEYLAAASLVMTHLSRWSEELVCWSNPLLGFVKMADAFVTGSSIMPQKRNPDVAELVRGKTGRVFGALTAVLTLLKAQPLAYNRDLQEDKPPLFDAIDTLEACLKVMVPLVGSCLFQTARLREACQQGFLSATDVADELARRGVPFRRAHQRVARAVALAADRGQDLGVLTLKEWKAISPEFGPWVQEALSLDRAVASRKSRGGTALREVARQIRLLRAQVKPS